MVGKVIKTLLKLYKMFYRLLRLKHWQRVEIEKRVARDILVVYPNQVAKERNEFLQELREWHHLAMTYMVKTPKELHELISDIQVRTMNEVVNDFTTWNDCDMNTGHPGEKYYRCNHGWVLVKMQARGVDKEYDIPAVAKFNKSSHLWTFSIIAEREMVRDLKVVKWRPIY